MGDIAVAGNCSEGDSDTFGADRTIAVCGRCKYVSQRQVGLCIVCGYATSGGSQYISGVKHDVAGRVCMYNLAVGINEEHGGADAIKGLCKYS